MQPSINIGTLGHVAHGKSTLVKRLTGVATMKHSKEQPRGITIKLGYANMKIWKCNVCKSPECYSSSGSEFTEKDCEICKTSTTLVRHVSFVDCPGHELLMATMLNGAAVMDAALLIIAADEGCPQPQTTEHLIAAEIMGLKQFVCAQTKLDLVNKETAIGHHFQIKQFIEGTCASSAPIVPICSYLGYNVDVILQYIVEKIPLPIKDVTRPMRMIIVRSFNINRSGASIDELQGGVLGGSIIQGRLKLNDEVEMRPGLVIKNGDDFEHVPLRFHVKSLMSEKTQLTEAYPGGLIAVGTLLDPNLTKDDRMIGQVLGHVSQLPNVYTTIGAEYQLMKRIVSEDVKIGKLSKGETLKLNINGATIPSQVLDCNHQTRIVKLKLKIPVCIDIGDRITISRNFNNKWRLIGWATFRE